MSGKHGGKREGSGRKRGQGSKLNSPVGELARGYTTEAINVLVEVMRDKEAAPAARAKAAGDILDRGHGKPAQATTLSGPDGGPIQHAVQYTDEDRARMVELLLARAGRKIG